MVFSVVRIALQPIKLSKKKWCIQVKVNRVMVYFKTIRGCLVRLSLFSSNPQFYPHNVSLSIQKIIFKTDYYGNLRKHEKLLDFTFFIEGDCGGRVREFIGITFKFVCN